MFDVRQLLFLGHEAKAPKVAILRSPNMMYSHPQSGLGKSGASPLGWNNCQLTPHGIWQQPSLGKHSVQLMGRQTFKGGSWGSLDCGNGDSLQTHMNHSLLPRAVGNDHFCDTAKRASQRLTPHIQGETPLYHRSGNKPLDSTACCLNCTLPPNLHHHPQLPARPRPAAGTPRALWGPPPLSGRPRRWFSAPQPEGAIPPATPIGD